MKKLRRKRIFDWMPCPFATPPSDGRGSGALMLDWFEVMDDPDNPTWPEYPFVEEPAP